MSAARNYVLFEAEAPVPIPTAPALLVEWEPRWNGIRSCAGTALARAPRLQGDPGRLYVQWEPWWRGFRAALRPALARSERPLAGECPLGIRSRRSTALSLLLHAAAIVVLLAVSVRVMHTQWLQAVAQQDRSQYQIIYYPGNELPQMDDRSGTAQGKSGKAGGRELYHPTQAIRIARGDKMVDTVADAPHLKLPATNGQVANLLAAPAKNPGPPPLAAVNSRNAAAGIFATPAAVPPPPQIKRDRLASAADLVAGAVQAPPDATRQVAGMRLPELGSAQVVPPPISAPAHDSALAGKLSLPASVAVAPPPQVPHSNAAAGVAGFGTLQDVVPPAPSIGGRALRGNGVPSATGSGTGMAVAPPPQIGAGGTADGGLLSGAMKALGSLLGAVTPSGPGGGSAVVVSANPGTGAGMPGGGGPGSLAMSPKGSNQSGMGGSGGGTGTGNGTGTGSGTAGTGTGSGNTGNGLGDGAAGFGTSRGPGAGGSGSGSGPSGIPGVTVSGGGTKVVIPSFSTANAGGRPARGEDLNHKKPAITVIASARSGGALNAYDRFKGAKVYTIYLDTRIGLAVLQYAEKAASAGSFESDLQAPEAVISELPPDVKRSRLLIACTLNRSGELTNLRVLEGSGSAKIMAALAHWRFRPVLKGEQPVDVDAILGFDIDTR